jgi:hypothetical protein
VNSKPDSRAVSVPDPEGKAANQVAEKILRVLSEVPASKETEKVDPVAAARGRANQAAIAAATAAGSLALPPGPLGWLTVLPELMAVWRIQARMVADIAAYFGKQGSLTREHMVYCLFRHAASQAVRDLVVRVGERAIIRSASAGVLNRVAQRIGVNLTQRVATRAASRWLPVVGALGVAAYAYYDTGQVAKSAIELFQRDLEPGVPDTT